MLREGDVKKGRGGGGKDVKGKGCVEGMGDVEGRGIRKEGC